MPRAHGIIESMRRRGAAVHGEAPWWNVSYPDLETRADALAMLRQELDRVDASWRDVLAAE
jgi:hypothetical protein